MPFWLYLILFLGVPIGVLGYRMRGYLWAGFYLRLQGIGALFLGYVAMLDNAASAARLWTFDRALTLGIMILYLPLERYLIFGLQTGLVILLCLWLWKRLYPADFGSS